MDTGTDPRRDPAPKTKGEQAFQRARASREEDAVSFIASMLAEADVLDVETVKDLGIATR